MTSRNPLEDVRAFLRDLQATRTPLLATDPIAERAERLLNALDVPGTEAPSISRELIAEWRAQQGAGMTSAVGECTPAEFWTLLDAYEALLRPHGAPASDSQTGGA